MTAPPRIVDAHTHLLPERLAVAIRGYFEKALGTGELAYPPGPDGARAALVAAGVDRCWSLPYVRTAGKASALNRWMSVTYDRDPRVEPGATVHPADDVAAVVDEAVEVFRARLFKLHCSVGDFSIADARLQPLWERASQGRLPVVVHLGHSPTGATESEELPALEAVLERWPALPLVLAHAAAPVVDGAFALMRRHPSLHVDLTPVVFQAAPIRAEQLSGLTDRILFGSDCPNVAIRIEDGLRHVRALGLGSAAEAAVLGGNADRLVPPSRKEQATVPPRGGT